MYLPAACAALVTRSKAFISFGRIKGGVVRRVLVDVSKALQLTHPPSVGPDPKREETPFLDRGGSDPAPSPGPSPSS